MSIWDRATTFIAGIAVGGAVEEAVAPTLEPVQQTAWRNVPAKVLDPGTAAQVDAQGLSTKVDLADDVARNGFGPARWALLQALALTAPGVAELVNLYRRGEISKGNFDHGLAKAQLEPMWWPFLEKLIDDRLDPATIANAVQQGFMANPNLLPTSPPTAPGNVKFGAVSPLDTLAEAAASGINPDRLKVMAELAGLPPGPMEMLEMLRRSIITSDDFRRGVAAGHTKTEWADAYLAMEQQILSPATAATLRLKGWIDAQASYDIGALSGLSPAQMDHLYQAGGRPPAPGQMATAVARGFATQADFTKAIIESDIRPEWAQLLFDIRHHYPSLFFTKAAVVAGEVDDQTAITWLTNQNYTLDVATKLVTSFHKTKLAKVKQLTEGDVLLFYESRYIDQAQATTDLQNLGYTAAEVTLLLEHADAQRIKRFLDAQVNRIHNRYVGWHITKDQAFAEIGTLGIPATARDDMLGLWDQERAGNQPALTPAQILTLLHEAHITPQAAHDSLVNRGYSDVSAQALVSHYAALGDPGSLISILQTPI